MLKHMKASDLVLDVWRSFDLEFVLSVLYPSTISYYGIMTKPLKSLVEMAGLY